MESPRQVTVNIANRTIIRTILWIALAIGFYHFLGRVSHVLTLIFASIFLALALNPVVSWSSRRLRIKSRAKATAITYLTVVVVLIAFFALIIPPLVRQTRDFIKDVPQTVENFQEQDSSLARSARRYNLDQKLTQAAKDFTSNYSDFGSTLLSTGRKVAEAVASVLVVLVMTFMMLVEGPRWLALFFGAVPAKKRKRYQSIAHKMYKGVTGFVNGQIILAAIAGTFAFLALEIASQILDVSINALALAGIVAMFGLIPLFGNPLAAAIVVLVCLLNSVTLGIVILIYFVVYFFIENHTLQPIIQSRLNNLTALSVFVAAIVGVGFAGFLGAIIAIPAATAIKILLEDYFERHHHQDTPTKTATT